MERADGKGCVHPLRRTRALEGEVPHLRGGGRRKRGMRRGTGDVAAMRSGRMPVRRVQRIAGLLLLQNVPVGQGLQQPVAQGAVAAAAAIPPPVPDRGRGRNVPGAPRSRLRGRRMIRRRSWVHRCAKLRCPRCLSFSRGHARRASREETTVRAARERTSESRTRPDHRSRFGWPPNGLRVLPVFQSRLRGERRRCHWMAEFEFCPCP